jgi:hypothetical protein
MDDIMYIDKMVLRRKFERQAPSAPAAWEIETPLAEDVERRTRQKRPDRDRLSKVYLPTGSGLCNLR